MLDALSGSRRCGQARRQGREGWRQAHEADLRHSQCRPHRRPDPARRGRHRLDDTVLQRSSERKVAMKLYYFETLNPRKACRVAKYLGSPVEFVRVDLTKGEHKKPGYLA